MPERIVQSADRLRRGETNLLVTQLEVSRLAHKRARSGANPLHGTSLQWRLAPMTDEDIRSGSVRGAPCACLTYED